MEIARLRTSRQATAPAGAVVTRVPRTYNTSDPVRVFVSGVASVAHLTHVAAYLSSLLEDDDAPVTAVFFDFVPFLGSVRVTAEDVAALLPSSPRLSVELATGSEPWHGRPDERLVYVAVGAPGIRPWARLRLANSGPLHVVVVDEGLGSYGDWRSRWYALRHERARRGHTGPSGLLRALAVSTAARLLTDERRPLYRRGRDGWTIDPRMAAAMRRAAGPVVHEPGTALLLSQPWVELGHVSAERYRDLMRELEMACAAAGMRLCVRPHPVEDRSRYAGMCLDKGTGPAELDPWVAGVGALIGFNSTALVTCATLHGTPALRLAIPELAGVEANMAADQRSLLEQITPVVVTPDAVAAALLASRGQPSAQ